MHNPPKQGMTGMPAPSRTSAPITPIKWAHALHISHLQARTGICAPVPPSSASWNVWETAHSMTLKVGFELEFYLLRPRRDENGVVQQEPLGHSHLYSQSSALLGAATGGIVKALRSLEI